MGVPEWFTGTSFQHPICHNEYWRKVMVDMAIDDNSAFSREDEPLLWYIIRHKAVPMGSGPGDIWDKPFDKLKALADSCRDEFAKSGFMFQTADIGLIGNTKPNKG